MKKFIKFEIHEYMDLHPELLVKFMDLEDAEPFAKHMQESYSGGTTRFIGIMSQSEARDYVNKQIDKERKHPQSDSDEFIQKLWKMYYEAYPRDIPKQTELSLNLVCDAVDADNHGRMQDAYTKTSHAIAELELLLAQIRDWRDEIDQIMIALHQLPDEID